MGTRGAYGFIINGKTKVSYNHSDSYPDGLGKDVVHFISRNSLAVIQKHAKSVKVVDSSKKPTATQLKKLVALNLADNDNDEEWYDLLRDYQGNLQMALENQSTFMTDDKSFLEDSLFCEYAYLINLDDGVLEFYKGFNEHPILTGRFANFPVKNGYYPVRHIKNYPLEDLFACDDSTIVADMQAQIGEDD